MRKTLVLLMVVMASIGLAACGGKKNEKPDASATNTSQNAGADASGVGQSQSTEEGAEAPGPQEGLLAKRTIYFDFDSSEIRGEGTEIVAAHAKYLATRGGMKVRLE